MDNQINQIALRCAIPVRLGGDSAILYDIRTEDGNISAWIVRGDNVDEFWTVGDMVQFGGQEWRVDEITEQSEKRGTADEAQELRKPSEVVLRLLDTD